jgi:3-oxoacyl-(acyl-carrier-protein) synthase
LKINNKSEETTTMSENNPLDSSLEKLSRERLAVLVKSLQGRLREQEQRTREPIAIVGAACRFPGAPDLNHFWELLHHGKDAVTNIPGERWDVEAFFDPAPETPGKMYTKAGGFIHNPTHFDSAFFGISRREAISMDPQQRLLLEIAWESLENAGIPAKRLRESDTGVFVGISTNDYLQLGCLYKEREQMDAYHGTGSAASIAAGRISYLLGLQGPTMAIDTACSSSLVALHLACNAIRNSECQMALVGGVNLMLSPDSTIYFCRVRALSTEGRCKSFSADADGYVRGEGCGFVVLKRLSDALKDRDNIMAVVRGSAVNHDGRTTGLTVPNTASQVKLLRSALQSASITADEVDYIEAHGTGTPLGDPIELNALSRVYESQESRKKKLWIGSAKTNIGHLEAAAGVAGLIKVILINPIPTLIGVHRISRLPPRPSPGKVPNGSRQSAPLGSREPTPTWFYNQRMSIVDKWKRHPRRLLLEIAAPTWFACRPKAKRPYVSSPARALPHGVIRLTGSPTLGTHSMPNVTTLTFDMRLRPTIFPIY